VIGGLPGAAEMTAVRMPRSRGLGRAGDAASAWRGKLTALPPPALTIDRHTGGQRRAEVSKPPNGGPRITDPLPDITTAPTTILLHRAGRDEVERITPAGAIT
jgi:hypothetical protein